MEANGDVDLLNKKITEKQWNSIAENFIESKQYYGRNATEAYSEKQNQSKQQICSLFIVLDEEPWIRVEPKQNSES